MGSDAPHCYVWLGTMQKMANAAKCKYIYSALLLRSKLSPLVLFLLIRVSFREARDESHFETQVSYLMETIEMYILE